MSDLDFCPHCRRYTFGNCKCCRFEVAIPWKGAVDECAWRTQYANDAESAVERWCDRYDAESADYTIITNGGADEVWCRDSEGTITRWSVRAETVPQYHAEELRTADSRNASPGNNHPGRDE